MKNQKNEGGNDTTLIFREGQGGGANPIVPCVFLFAQFPFLIAISVTEHVNLVFDSGHFQQRFPIV